jgi:hypothetical protein
MAPLTEGSCGCLVSANHSTALATYLLVVLLLFLTMEGAGSALSVDFLSKWQKFLSSSRQIDPVDRSPVDYDCRTISRSSVNELSLQGTICTVIAWSFTRDPKCSAIAHELSNQSITCCSH